MVCEVTIDNENSEDSLKKFGESNKSNDTKKRKKHSKPYKIGCIKKGSFISY